MRHGRLRQDHEARPALSAWSKILIRFVCALESCRWRKIFAKIFHGFHWDEEPIPRQTDKTVSFIEPNDSLFFGIDHYGVSGRQSESRPSSYGERSVTGVPRDLCPGVPEPRLVVRSEWRQVVRIAQYVSSTRPEIPPHRFLDSTGVVPQHNNIDGVPD
jgi:hypothetical protein